MSSIALRRVSYRVGNTAILTDLSLDFAEGSVGVILGRSGAGKTSLVRLIAGLERPSSGSVFIDGEPVDHLPPHARGVGLVFQERTLLPHLSLGKNIGLALWVKGVPQPTIDKAVRTAAEMLGIADLLERRPDQVSGGQSQRAELARALVAEPRILLLDEAFGSVDVENRRAMSREVLALAKRRRMTLVLVTHDQELALAAADSLAILERGALMQSGSARDVFELPANTLVARFLGSPGMNILSEIPSSLTSVAGPDDVVGFRPTEVRLSESGSTGPSIEGSCVGSMYGGHVYEVQFLVGPDRIYALMPEAPPIGKVCRLDLLCLHRFSRDTGQRR